MKLPVHTKLREHIACPALGARSHFLIDLGILEAHISIALMCLGKHGKVIVSNLSHGICALVDTVPDLMGDAPAKILTAHVLSSFVGHHRHSAHHTACGAPADTDVVARSVHKRFRKHPLVADILMPLGNLVYRLRGVLIQPLVLIEQVHHILHGIHGIQHLLSTHLRRAAACAGQNLRCRQREHHGIQKDIGSSQNTGLSVISVLIHQSIV